MWPKGIAAALWALWMTLPISLLAESPSVRITSPTEGAVFRPGQTLEITVKATPLAFRTVVVIGDLPLGFSQILTAPPYRFQIKISTDIVPGAYTLTAVGDSQRKPVVNSEPVTVAIERPDSPQSLNTDLSLTFEYIGDSLALAVSGALLTVQRFP